MRYLFGAVRASPTLAIAAAILAGCGPASERPVAPGGRPAETLPFRDVTAESGIDFAVRGARGDRTNILDTIGHGVAILDWDGDDLPDVILTGPGRVSAYRNQGGFRFEKADLGFRQVGRWGGAAVADVDNNGWPDIYLTGYGCAALYLNDHGRFRDVTAAAGLRPPNGKFPAWGTSAGFADLDNDGWADLVVCYYLEFGPASPQRCPTHLPNVSAVCPPKAYAPQHARAYRNAAGRRFEDVTAEWGLRGHGAALGVAFQDADGNGRTDVTVANDEMPGDLFLNDGGRFREAGAERGTAYDGEGRVYAGMGIDWGDVNDDRRPDLAATSFYGEQKLLFVNGGGAFQEAGAPWGLAAPTLADVAFGARFLDFDNDGRQDLMLANGHIQENAGEIRREASYLQPLRVFRNMGSRFESIADGSWPRLVGRALATADFDNDGGLDALVTSLSGNVLLLRNVADRGHWLGLRLVGRRANRMGLGARVEVTTGGRTRRFEVHTAGSYMAASDPRLFVGLGAQAVVDQVVVRWPGGGRTVRKGGIVDRWSTLEEP